MGNVSCQVLCSETGTSVMRISYQRARANAVVSRPNESKMVIGKMLTAMALLFTHRLRDQVTKKRLRRALKGC